jgi:integrase
VRLHDLRHSHATLGLAASIPAKVMSERLGHGTVAITLDLYSHVMPGMQEEAAAKLGALVLGS